MSDDPLTVGFLGYRFMGDAHANALARLPMFFPEAPAVERDVLIGRDEAALADAFTLPVVPRADILSTVKTPAGLRLASAWMS